MHERERERERERKCAREKGRERYADASFYSFGGYIRPDAELRGLEPGAPGGKRGKMPPARGVGKWKDRREGGRVLAVENFNLLNYTCYDNILCILK